MKKPDLKSTLVAIAIGAAVMYFASRTFAAGLFPGNAGDSEGVQDPAIVFTGGVIGGVTQIAVRLLGVS